MPLVLLRTHGGHARFRENVDSAGDPAALGLEAAAGDLMVVEDGPAPRARKEREKVAEIRC